MEYPRLVPGVLLRRYKRFLADIRLDDGREVVAHCPNTGSMRAVNVPGCRVWLAPSDNPARKLAWTWELIELTQPDGSVALASVHTGRTNRIVEEALSAGRVPALAGYATLRREARVEGARLDFRLDDDERGSAYVEVKQVTLKEFDGHGYFPDAVSERGRKHLLALAALSEQGQRAVLLFCVAHTGIRDVAPAAHLDPAYAATLRAVVERGVEVVAHGCEVGWQNGSPVAITLGARLPVSLTRQVNVALGID
ncbi:MAG: DNA/RNA nuclease SfsA [Halomonas sp.]|jgi:sugar fermentation stimulation protein A|uniref:Sugar fermentation stimulation protein homolog n=1 Tax=Billgrantia tianxiuensis TaxID=2497861 RepID=A0A6I6SWB8_9GAMM|nr:MULTISPECIES: DNA/RNA nuclease SfsA [Halomonas]MCE8035863.1 DNA/RNA nuclease SfsA [Halomonas sp. MCCC 1A11057]MDX5434790.1 DNA/RNA nuclease SfsA [Halomonas sp.]QHC51733.1 DNA/RNA nuclease SfsA [Halomonas tianxiuensis]